MPLKRYGKVLTERSLSLRGEVVIGIYQTPVGTDFNFESPYVKVTIQKNGTILIDPVSSNGEEDEDDQIGVSTDDKEISDFNSENSSSNDWNAIIKNLPKYDETGHLYSYIAIEDKNADDFGASYVKGYYDATGDYSTVITNQPGEATYIMVQKNWIDDGDLKHREPVELGLYYANSDDELMPVLDENNKPVTGKLDGMDGSWTSVIGFTLPENDNVEKVDIKDIYIVEHKVGDSVVNYGGTVESGNNIPDIYEWSDGHYSVNDGDVWSSHIFDVTTDNHRYQVSYEKQTDSPSVPKGIDALYTVTNRRLGEIDVTVDKKWVSGYDDPNKQNDGINKLTKELKQIKENNDFKEDAKLFFNLKEIEKLKLKSEYVKKHNLWSKLSREQKQYIINKYIDEIEMTIDKDKKVSIVNIVFNKNEIENIGYMFRNDCFDMIININEQDLILSNFQNEQNTKDYITNLRNFYNIKETNITGEILDISEFNTNDIVQIIPHEKNYK